MTAPIEPVNPIRIADVDDREAVVTTVVAAFERDPAFRYFFPDDLDYPSQASAFVRYLFDKRVSHRSVWVTPNCEAVALWSPPGGNPHGKLTTSVAEQRDAMFRAIGPHAAERLHLYDAAVAGALPEDEPYWYLGVLAAHPDHAGRGLGGAVMRGGLQHARHNNGIAFLETTNPANVPYYRRAGWELVSTIDSELPLTVWVFLAK